MGVEKYSFGRKYGLFNRINMSKETYTQIKEGELPKVLLSNAMINSCVPDHFEYIVEKQRKSIEKMLVANQMVVDMGLRNDFKQHFYVNRPKVKRYSD